jgi:hypothetical protein
MRAVIDVHLDLSYLPDRAIGVERARHRAYFFCMRLAFSSIAAWTLRSISLSFRAGPSLEASAMIAAFMAGMFTESKATIVGREQATAESLARSQADRVLVATARGPVVGVVKLHFMSVLHEDRALGRLTALVVRRDWQRAGLAGAWSGRPRQSPGPRVEQTRIHFRHALKNTLIPVITVTGLQLGSIIAFAIITETVFQWPGMGSLVIQAITFGDIPVLSKSRLASIIAFPIGVPPRALICAKAFSVQHCMNVCNQEFYFESRLLQIHQFRDSHEMPEVHRPGWLVSAVNRRAFFSSR